MPGPLCIPHHLGGNSWPPNTVYALKHALKYSSINNITLVLTKDNIPIAFHGFNLNTTTNGYGNPESYTFNELKTLDAAYNFKIGDKYPLRQKNIKLASFKELLLSLPLDSKYQLIVDLKSRNNLALIKRVISTINSMPNANSYYHRLIFYSTDDNSILNLQKLAPQAQYFLPRKITLDFLLNLNLPSAQQLNAYQWIGFEMERNLCEKFTLGKNCVLVKNLWTSNKIKRLKAINPHLKVVVFAADSKNIQNQAKKAGADYIYVNLPTKFCKSN